MRNGEIVVIAFVLFVSMGTAAFAYIGPGAGIALVGTVFGAAAAVVVTLLMIVAWPAWLLWKKCKSKKTRSSKE